MLNIASLMVLALLALTFIQSGYEKVMDWKGNIAFLQSVFAKTFLKNLIHPALLILLIFEIISGILSTVGCIQILVNNDRTFGLYGAIFSCITLLIMLFGQRLVKDYDGARTIVIYYIPAVLAVYWLS